MDLGSGSGRAARRIASHFTKLHITLLDADQAMLAFARSRLAGLPHRTSFVHATFQDRRPGVDAIVASLALHHVVAAEQKVDVYRNLKQALKPEGVLLVADAMLPANRLQDASWRRWAEHLVQNGLTEAQAQTHFTNWAKEERYFGVDDQLTMMREAGFGALDVRWRKGPLALLVAR
jgi:ubiquinone/menaquinone biosynthesis C-methylase UbiE